MFNIPIQPDIEDTTIYTEYSNFSVEDYDNMSDNERFKTIANEVGLVVNNNKDKYIENIENNKRKVMNELLSQQ